MHHFLALAVVLSLAISVQAAPCSDAEVTQIIEMLDKFDSDTEIPEANIRRLRYQAPVEADLVLHLMHTIRSDTTALRSMLERREDKKVIFSQLKKLQEDWVTASIVSKSLADRIN